MSQINITQRIITELRKAVQGKDQVLVWARGEMPCVHISVPVELP